jgi:uncharacterized protein involved in outer membrane biogenesis
LGYKNRMRLPALVTRYRYLWIGLAITLLAYTLFGFFAVPRLVESTAKNTVAADYGRQLAIGQVRFNPFSLQLEIDNLSLPDADGSPLIGFRKLLVNLQTSSLWRRALTFRDISLAEPQVRAVIRPGGALNLADLAPADEPAAPAEPEPLPRILIHNLQISDGGVRFEDRDRLEPFIADITPISFTLADFSTHTESGNLYEFDARIFESAQLAWRGTLNAQPMASDGQLAITGLPLPELARYLGDALPVAISAGHGSLRGTYRFSAADEEVALELQNGDLSLGDLRLRRPGDASDYAALPELRLAGIRADLAAQTVDVTRLEVSGGSAEGWIGPDGTPVLAALAERLESRVDEAATSAAASSEDEAPPWTVNVPAISVRGFQMALEDRQVQPPAAFKLDPVNVTVEGFSTRPGTTVRVTSEIVINGKAKLGSAMQVNLDTLATEGTLDLGDFDLTTLQPYVADAAPGLIVSSGTANVKGQVAYTDAEPEADTRFTGDASVAKMRSVDKTLQEDFVKWETLDLRGIDYRSKPERLKVGSVALRSPYARVVIGPDQTTNISTVLGEPAESPATNTAAESEAPAGEASAGSPAAEPPAMPIRIGRVRIDDGSMNFADLSLRPEFRTGIEKLKGTITGLSSDAAARATVEVDGQVGKFSPVTIRGQVNPLAAETFLDMSMTFRNMEMASFTPYSGRFAGYSIRQGKLSLDLNYTVENRQLNANHDIVIDQLELGDKVESEDSVPLPLELAVALLKDKNGVIDLDLPVTGNLDDPQFRIGPIIWKAFVNLLTKAVTAPFALLGGLFGGGGEEEVNLIDFGAGDAALSEAEAEKLTKLVTALTERPGLQLNIPAVYSSGTDQPALIERGLQQQVLAAKHDAEKSAEELTFDSVAADREDYLRQLKTAFRQVAGRGEKIPDPPEGDDDDTPEAAIAVLEDAIRHHVAVAEPELFELARQRAVAVQERLLTGTGVDPTRVFLTSPAEAKSEGGVVVMELTLR